MTDHTLHPDHQPLPRAGDTGVGRGVLWLLVAGIGLGAAYNALGLQARRPWGLPWIAVDKLQTLPTVAAGTPPAAAYTTDISDPLAIPAPAAQGLPEIPAAGRPVQIELSALKLYVDAGAALLIDAREPAEYAEGHIRGAINLPYETAVSDPTLIEGLQTGGRPLVTYCGGGSCEMSLSLAEELFYAGNERVAVYMGGYPEWVAAGYAVSHGEAP